MVHEEMGDLKDVLLLFLFDAYRFIANEIQYHFCQSTLFWFLSMKSYVTIKSSSDNSDPLRNVNVYMQRNC